ncbi:MAG TPA: nucleotide exchange factor GrpE [bacterium]|nr:nucleotide exchange factor GrpE [bacterium]
MTNKHRTKVDELRSALKKKREARDPKGPEPGSEVEETRAASGENDAEEIEDQLRAAEEEAKGHYDKLLRVMAEFENFKKRIGKEQDEQLRYSNEKLLSDLLPSLDDLDRVLDHVPPDASAEAKAIADGVELVRKTLHAVLERYGLREVAAMGEPFDPAHHEAMAAVESVAHKPDSVMAVHRKGYWLGERLLRPAMVTVAKGKG